MITKIGKMVLAEELSEDEAAAMRRKHLVKGLLTPVVGGPVLTLGGAGAGMALGSLIGKLAKNPETAERLADSLGGKGALLGGLTGIGLGIRHLYRSGATRADLQREKERNSIIDW